MYDFIRDTMIEKLEPISDSIFHVEFGNGVRDAFDYLYAIDVLLSECHEITERTDGAKVLHLINTLKREIEDGVFWHIENNKDKMQIDKKPK